MKVSGVEQQDGCTQEYVAQVDLRVNRKVTTLLNKIKKGVCPRDVRQVLWQLHESAWRWQNLEEKPEAAFFLIAQSISPGAKEILRNERVGYYDSGGSLFLSDDNIYCIRGQAAPEEPVAVHPFRVFGPLCTSAALSSAATSRVVWSE